MSATTFIRQIRTSGKGALAPPRAALEFPSGPVHLYRDPTNAAIAPSPPISHEPHQIPRLHVPFRGGSRPFGRRRRSIPQAAAEHPRGTGDLVRRASRIRPGCRAEDRRAAQFHPCATRPCRGRGLVVALRGRRAARTLLAQQELHVDRGRPGTVRRQAEPRRSRAQVLPGGGSRQPEQEPELDEGPRPAEDVHGPARRGPPGVPFPVGEEPREDLPGDPGPGQARHAFCLQYGRHVHAVGDRPEGHGPDRALLPRAAPLRAPRDFGSHMGCKRPGDIPRFGQLYLQKGQWRGRQLVPPGWVDAATSLQISNGSDPASDWDQGYGYQFWRCRHGFYRGDGAFGQFCVVMPEFDAVVAITGATRDLPSVLNVVWDQIVPALSSAPLAADPESDRRLSEKLAGLSLATQAGQPGSPVAARIAGRRYVFPANPQLIESVEFEPVQEGANVAIKARIAGRDQRIVCGRGAWLKGSLTMGPGAPIPVALSGAWTSDDTYTAILCRYRTPFCATFDMRFSGDELILETENNVGFDSAGRVRLVGRAQP